MAHCNRSVSYVSCTGFEHDSWMNQKMNCSLWMMTITPTMTRTWCWGWGWWDHAAVVVMKRWSFRFFRSLLSNSCETDIVWLVVYLPLWKIWVRQLGLLFPTEWRVIKFHGSSHHQPDMNIWQTKVLGCDELLKKWWHSPHRWAKSLSKYPTHQKSAIAMVVSLFGKAMS